MFVGEKKKLKKNEITPLDIVYIRHVATFYYLNYF
jgi:hypothetical protein